MKKEKILKIVKKLIIMIAIAIVLEVLLMGYYFCIKKIYRKKHLIGNDPIELQKNVFEISEKDEWGYNYLIYNDKVSNVYNVEVIMKEENNDAYIRVLFNNDAKIMNKQDKEQKIFKAYFDNTTLNGFKIAFIEQEIAFENIDKIVINDNLNYVKDSSFSFSNFLIFLGIIFFIDLIIVCLKKIERKDIKIKKEKMFLIIALTIGTIFCFTNLVFTKYDEHAHFWRAYELSVGSIVSGKQNRIPKSVFDVIINKDSVLEIEGKSSYNKTLNKLNMQLNPENTSNKLVGATAGLSPFSYIPQIVGITIGRIMKLNPVIIGLMGRFANLIAYIILIYFAIKLMPKEKWKNLIILIALLPMSLDLAASMSPDAVIISTSIFVISYLLNLKFNKKECRYVDIIILGFFTMVLSICKIVYLPIGLLLLMIPKEKFGSKKQLVLKYLLFAFIVIIPILLWNIVSKPNAEIAIRTSTQEQIYFTLADPMTDLETAKNTLWYNTGEYILTMIGGWNTPTIINCIFFSIAIFVIFGHNDNDNEKEYKLLKKDYIIMTIATLITILLIFAGLYVTWTRAQFTICEGVQGRYFLPILLPILLMIEKNLIKKEIKISDLNVCILYLMLYIPIIVNTIEYFNV